jgi:uncharacterized membrane protein YbhN (UPF0104 family)
MWLLSFSPPFYFTFSGALIGALVNLLTGLFFLERPIANEGLFVVGVLLLLISSAGFCYLGIVLEQWSTERERRKEDKTYLWRHQLPSRRKAFQWLPLAGFLFLLISILLIILSRYVEVRIDCL